MGKGAENFQKVFLRRVLVGFVVFLSWGHSYAQTSTCAQTLRLVRSTYEQGRFHEIPALLESCLEPGEGNFTKQERVEALRILTLAYIYREEPDLADQTMMDLLRTDHYFEINENVDPAEFTALYKTFRTKPLFALGLRFGANSTIAAPRRNFFVGSNAGNKGEYSLGYGIQLAASFEKELFKKENNKWTAAPEIMYITSSYSYANEALTLSDQTGDPYSGLEAIIDQSRLDINALAQYKLLNSIINPYIMFGIGASYLMKADLLLETEFPQKGTAVSGPSIDLKNSYKTLDYSAILGAGIKFKFGEIYLIADLRYKYGLTNTTQVTARSNPEATFDYGFINNDLNQGNIIANIGFIWPYFKPKKLLK
jgi:hypothetical protein